MDPDLIAAIAVPGVLQPRQERSRKVVASLVQAALEVLRSKDFAALSVAEVSAAAGLTTGGFYKRFPSKDLFIEFLQRLIVEEMRAGMGASLTVERFNGLPLREFLHKTVGATVRWYRQYEGFVRASLRHAQLHPETWSPMRETGARYAAAVEPIVSAIVGREAAALRDATRFAIQTMLGVLNSIVMIDPGPCRLRDDRTVTLLTNAMALVIEQAAHDEARHVETAARSRRRGGAPRPAAVRGKAARNGRA